MVGLAIEVAAFLFLAWVAWVAFWVVVGIATLIPPKVWKISGCAVGALLLWLLYTAVPDMVIGLAGIAVMGTLAWIICAGIERLRDRHRAKSPGNLARND